MAPYAGGVYTWDPYPTSGSPQFESTARSTLTEWKTNSESMEARLTAFDDGSGFVTNTIPGATIVTGSVSDTQLATDSVIEVKIAAGAVTNAKLADTAVSTTKMSDQAVTPAKIDTNGQALSDLDVLRYNSTTLKFDPVPIGAAGDTYEVKKNAGDTPGFLDDQIVGYLANIYTDSEVNNLLLSYYTKTAADSLLAGKSATGHLHDSRYYLKTEWLNQHLANSGFVEMPDGTIIQWGTSAVTEIAPISVTLPTGMSNADYIVVFTDSNGQTGVYVLGDKLSTEFTLAVGSGLDHYVNWIAIGY